MRSSLWLVCLLLFGVGFLPLQVMAQEGPPPRPGPAPVGISAIPFNFGPPGARSLGMGNAFIAIADDATASEANPAGLTQLSRPEISLHGRYTSYESQFVDLSAVDSLNVLNHNRSLWESPDYPPLPPNSVYGNAFAGDPLYTFDESQSDISYASYVQPVKNWVFSAYYERLSDFLGSGEFEAYDDSFMDLYNTELAIGTSAENIGLSVAVRLGKVFSLGASVRQTTLDVSYFSDIQISYFFDFEALYVDQGSSLDDVRGTPVTDYYGLRDSIDGNDSDITYNAGVLIKASAKFSVGLVYKYGGDYQIPGYSETYQTFLFEDPGYEVIDIDWVERVDTVTSITIPDLFGIGFSWRPTESLTIALDANYITYSDLDSQDVTNPDLPPWVADELEPVDDATEFHLGIEYSFFPGGGTKPLSIRAGVFTELDHDGFSRIDSDETNYTLGFGAVISKSFQFDLAGRFSDTVTEGALSMIFRF